MHIGTAPLLYGGKKVPYIRGKCYDKSVEIIRCFDEKDVEGLKSLFCQYSQDNDSIYSEIEEAFNMYEGKSVSFEFRYRGGVSGEWRNGKAVDEHVHPKIENIITDFEKNITSFIWII